MIHTILFLYDFIYFNSVRQMNFDKASYVKENVDPGNNNNASKELSKTDT